jgi:hypothetical protein
MTDTTNSPLDEQDIVELAEFFDLLGKFDDEDKQKERSKI